MKPALTHRLPPLFLFLSACATAIAPSTEEPQGNPRKEEVPLASESDDWNAFLIHDNEETGVWTVGAFPFFEQYACPEVIGLDDRGRCIVCVSYSGKWTPTPIIEDGAWLGGLAHGDVDPRIEGAELYTGGKRGNLYQVLPYREGMMDFRRIAHLPGREIHTLVAGDVDPSSEGAEILVFTRPGGLFRVRPTGPDGTFVTELVTELSGRVRDALLLPAEPGEIPQIATVTRAGKLELLRVGLDGPQWTTIHEDAMGMGRLALAPARQGRGPVLYSTHDDGRVLRHERDEQQNWHTETILRGPQGPRGIAAGVFDADPARETLAIFGYSKEVLLLTRMSDGWHSETLFIDRAKGHWLAAAELDGRNGTTELIGSGYGSRIFLLTRPPGYGIAR